MILIPMMRQKSRLAVAVAFLTHLFAVEGGPHNAKNEVALHAHFRGLIDKKAHTFPHAAPLPLVAAGPILHVDLDLVTRKPAIQASFFDALLEDETATRAAAASDSRFPYVLCGPQSSSSKARREISAASGPLHRTQVMYTSRHHDVACWKGQLHAADAIALESSDSFFHVAPIPKISKLAPGLVQLFEARHGSGADITERLTIDPLVFSQGLNLFFDVSSSKEQRVALLDQWHDTDYGLTVGSAKEESFVPLLWAKSSFAAAPWVAKSTAGLDCSPILAVNAPKEYNGVGYLLLNFKPRDEDENVKRVSCFIRAIYHIASSSAVAGLEVTSKARLSELPGHKKSGDLRNQVSDKIRELGSSSGSPGEARSLNYIAVTALQSGSSSRPYPFWSAGINGSNQYVQIADSGFDDASCFLRNTDESKSVLKGPFNFDVQLQRSTYDKPITDFSRRKIVQYIAVSNSSDTYEYDDETGHGTHVAGTVAGFLSSDEDDIAVKDGLTTCSFYPESVCSSLFCATCELSYYCDVTCGFVDMDDDEVYSGMAPSAKIMAFDMGNGDGNGLSTPSDLDSMMIAPAYNAGARVFSNSWGSVGTVPVINNTVIGPLYDGTSMMMDTLIYNYDDALVVFSAGNDGGSDGIILAGDQSIRSPATTKNVLTVGAAETETTPDTIASFSSRGPTTDYRIKPEVCGPGNPIYSAASSGLPGNATCAVKPMSGTSMATPAVSGVAAIVRQFLVDGKHEIYSNVGFQASYYNLSHPSSALLKAMLIGSTVPLLSGYNSTGYPITLADFYSGISPASDIEPYALGTTGVDYHQGFGHVLLSNVLSLDGGFDTFLYESSLGAYASYTLEFFVVATTTEVDVTLVWTDPPGSAYCDYFASSCLVHDLDLRVTHNGNRLYSNFGAASSGTYAGEEDTQNNVEKTTIASSTLSVGDSIAVVVTTESGLAAYDSQKFALVITGSIVSHSPTQTPTLEPTSEDTFTVAVSLSMITTQPAVSSTESTTLKNTIATTAGVDTIYITNFAITITPARRRRRLLASYTWLATFDVVVPLSTISANTPTDFEDSMTTALETNLATNVQMNMGLIITVSEVSTVVATRYPSSMPTPQPSVNQSKIKTTQISSISDSSISGATIGAVVAGLVLYLFCAGVILKLYWDLQKAKSELAMIGGQNTAPSSSSSNPVRNSSTTSSVELTNVSSTSLDRLPFEKPRAKLIGPTNEPPEGMHDAVL